MGSHHREGATEVPLAHRLLPWLPGLLACTVLLLGAAGALVVVDGMSRVPAPGTTMTPAQVAGLARWMQLVALVLASSMGIGLAAVTMASMLRHRVDADVAARAAMDAAIAATEGALAAAEDASVSKSRLIARVSHELRTPMNGVVGMTEVLLAEHLPPGIATRLQVLDHSAQAMRHILDELLQFSRGEAGFVDMDAQPFDLHELLEGRAVLHANPARLRGSQLVLDVSVDVPRIVIGDGVRVGQVLGNLVDNATKYAQGGPIIVRVHRVPDGIGFAVVDHGPGVPATHRDRVFEAFARLDNGRQARGTGLGLTLCRQIVDAMGGRIGVRDTPGGGATFWFTLPLETATPSAEPLAGRASLPDVSDLRVLAVDDNAINLTVLGAMLRSMGVHHTLVRSGADALARMDMEPFDIVLMDVEMPGMDGKEATRRLRDAGYDVPVLAFTAHAMVDEQQACLDAGMADVLAKPVTLDLLHRALARWGPDRAEAAVPSA
ncbi:MAG: response regulator [Alphaproteobacteria bacterium]|nr:response regulator [Alphaproteobacteria bacterium]